jgi:hypothetical protein
MIRRLWCALWGHEPVAALIARSSIGAGLANIRENGIAVELADLDEEPLR